MQVWLVIGKDLDGESSVLGVFDSEDAANNRKYEVEDDNGRSIPHCCEVIVIPAIVD